MMYLSPYFLIITALLISSCGGGDSSATISNSPPVISSYVGLADNSASGTVEASESFDLLLKITDADNDTITGVVELNGASVNLSTYSGNDDYSHQVSYLLNRFGDYTATITVSDGTNADVTVNYDLTVIPNNTEVQTELEANISNFVTGSEFKGVTLLGKSTDEFNTTIGYLASVLSEDNIAYNAAPSGECGVNTPHNLLSIDITSSGIAIPDVGMVFPLECLSATQKQKINTINVKQRKTTTENETVKSATYIAQNFTITDDSETGITIVQTGGGIALEGVVKNVTCGDFTLSLLNGKYYLSDEKIQSSLASLTSQSNNFTLSCQRSVEFNSVEENAPLLATITGELQATDSTFPTGSIDVVTFSIPYLTGGLDQGSICVNTTSNDNDVVASETLSVVADDGLTDILTLTLDDSTNQYCGNLQDFDGSVHVSQVITDNANNALTNISNSYPIEKNDAPVFSNELAESITLKVNEGQITLVTEADVVDPENQPVTLSGETSFNTNQALGEYTITASATDPYSAQSRKTINITLSDNTAPTATISLSGNPSKIGEAIRDINNSITLVLSSSDSDGTVNDSSLTTNVNGDAATDIINYSSIYSHDISGDGGNTRNFTYQVTDNNGLNSVPETLEIDVHLNSPPTYSGAMIYSAERGNCVTVQQLGNDTESDDISFAIEGGNWQLCQDNVTQVTKNVTITDKYQASNTAAITANFTACTAPAYWNGSSCFVTDTRPDAFSFISQTDVAINSIITSNTIIVSGINTETYITISGNGSYSINGGSYTSAAGTVNNGDTVRVRVTSSSFANMIATTLLNISGVNEVFVVTTGEVNKAHALNLLVTSPYGDLRVDSNNSQIDYLLEFFSTLRIDLSNSTSSSGTMNHMQVVSDLRGLQYAGNSLSYDVIEGAAWSIETFTMTLVDDQNNTSVASFTIAWEGL